MSVQQLCVVQQAACRQASDARQHKKPPATFVLLCRGRAKTRGPSLAFLAGTPLPKRHQDCETVSQAGCWLSLETSRAELISLIAGKHPDGCRIQETAPNQLMLYGGLGADGKPVNDAWMLDITKPSWTCLYSAASDICHAQVRSASTGSVSCNANPGH